MKEEWLTRLLNVCFVVGVVLVDWCSVCKVLLYKIKCDKNKCQKIKMIFFISIDSIIINT